MLVICNLKILICFFILSRLALGGQKEFGMLLFLLLKLTFFVELFIIGSLRTRKRHNSGLDLCKLRGKL